jgi:outer membrane protein assembly factor BamD
MKQMKRKSFERKIEKKYLKMPKDTIQYQISTALVALDNFIADYPGTPYKEDACLQV